MPFVTITRGASLWLGKRPSGWPEYITSVCSSVIVARYCITRRYCAQFPGKSTLFNALLNEEATRESDRFFSSIDPKIRKFSLFGKPFFLLDTVGFISNMSKDITDAFNSTFSEIAASDLILHIIDSTENGWEAKKKFVDELLLGSGCDKKSIIPLFSKKGKIKIKRPLRKGFFYDAFDTDDITKIKKFIYEKLTEEE